MTILEIHTKEWKPKLSKLFLSELAERCEGYCGADLKALCTEAGLLALGRVYPQVYTTNLKLDIDVASIDIAACDIIAALTKITPAQKRSGTTHGRKLPIHLHPLINRQLGELLTVLETIMPAAYAARNKPFQM